MVEQASPNPDDRVNVETGSEIVQSARKSLSSAISTIRSGMDEDIYKIDTDHKPEIRGDLTMRSVRDLVDIIDEIGIENLTLEPGVNPPTLTYTNSRGYRMRINASDFQSVGKNTLEKKVHVEVLTDQSEAPNMVMDYNERQTQYYGDYGSIVYTSRIGNRDRELKLVTDSKVTPKSQRVSPKNIIPRLRQKVGDAVDELLNS